MKKPTVKSVKADVNGDVKIEFSEPLAAVNPVVEVNGVAATVASVSANDTVVTATPATALEAGKTYTVFVAEAQDLVGNKSDISNTTLTTSGADLSAVTAVAVVDEDTVKVTFSKELKAIAGTDFELTVRKGLKQSAAPIAITSAKLDPDDTTNKSYLVDVAYDIDGGGADLFTSSSTTSESIELYINNFQDAFGNKVTTPVAKAATLVKDTVKPTLASAQVASNFASLLSAKKLEQ